MKEHYLENIWITLYERKSFRTGRMWYRRVSKLNILCILDFLSNTFDNIKEIKIYNDKGKEYKKAKEYRIKGILIEFTDPLKVKSFKKEYLNIYKPINTYLYDHGCAIYNMWGRDKDIGHWQMDGRHISWDKDDAI